MAVEVVLGGSPSFANGKLDPGNGLHISRVTWLKVDVEMRPEVAGTLAKACRVSLLRDASQGSAADLAGYTAQFASGRAEMKVQKLWVLFIDDVRAGKPALIGQIECEQAQIIESQFIDDDSPMQQWSLTGNGYRYFNAISGRYEPEEAAFVHGFNEVVHT